MENKFDQDFKQVLQDPELGQEIAPDVQAMDAAGLAELELESILAEDWDSVPDQEETKMTPEEALNRFLYEEDAPVEVPEEVPQPQQPVYSMDEPTRVIPIPVEEIPEVMDELEDFPVQEETKPDMKKAPAPVRKTRPKMKKGYGLLGIPHILSTAIWLAITLAIGISLGRVLWVCCADVMAFGKPQVNAVVTVTEQDDITTISQKLADAHLIRYPGLFQKFAEITEKHNSIQPGDHELGSHLDYNAMINRMVYTGGGQEEVEIIFPEGYNCAQTFRLLETNGICSAADLEEWAANGELKEYWFLEGIERGSKYCLEGYLAPDTYRFYTDSDPRTVLEKFLNEFDDRFTDIMKEDLAQMQTRYADLLAKNGYSSEYISAHPLTLHQVVSLASVVERETSSSAESYDIASVFYNRVTNPNVLNMGSDATVYYAIGDYFHDKKELDQADLDSDSPYNTRKAAGIPPGPICNPGAYSLYAALDPNDTNFHYFVYDAANYQHLFSATYDEHLQKVKDLGL